MASGVGEIESKVAERLQDQLSILSKARGPGAISRAIASAVEQYSKDRPLEKAVSVDGDGGFDYALPTGFVDGFSMVQAIYYPYLTTDQDPPALDPDEWTMFRTATGPKIRFLADSPTAAEDFLVQFTAAHTLSASTSTIPSTDDEAVADLAAAEAYLMLAGYFAVQSNDSSIQVDSVDRRTKAQECRDQAAAYRKSYSRKIGADTETVRPASAWGDVDSAFGDFTRSDYFAHGRRRF